MAELSLTHKNLQDRTPSYITRDTTDEITSLALSLDGSLVLAGSLDDSAHAYLVTSGGKEFSLVDRPYGVSNLKFTSNNNLIYSNRKGHTGILKKISLHDKSVMWLANSCHSSQITCIDTGIYDNCVTVSRDRVIKVWDLKCDKCVHSATFPGKGNPKARFDSSCSVIGLINALDSGKSYLKFYDIRKMNEAFSTVDHSFPPVTDFEFTDDGMHILVSCETNKAVLLESIGGGVQKEFVDYKNESGRSVASLTENSKFLAIGCENKNHIKVFDTESGDLVSQYVAHPRAPKRVLWSKHYGLLFSACSNLIFWAIDE